MNVLVDDGDLPIPKVKDYIKTCNTLLPSQIFTWGGPYVIFRIDNVVVLIKSANVREIIPPES